MCRHEFASRDRAEALDVVERFLEAFVNHDLEGLIDLLDENVYLMPSGSEFSAARGDYSGHSGYRDWWEITGADDLTTHPLAVEALDDHHVFVHFMTGYDSGQAFVSIARGCVYTVDRGKVAAMEIFEDAERGYERAHQLSPTGGSG